MTHLANIVTDVVMSDIMSDVYNDYDNSVLDDMIALSILRNLFMEK